MWAKIGMAVKNFAKGKVAEKAMEAASNSEGESFLSRFGRPILIGLIPVMAVVLLLIAPLIVIHQAFANIYVIQAVDPDSNSGSSVDSAAGLAETCLTEGKTNNVFFIGNSKTNMQNIFSQFRVIAESKGYDVNVEVTSYNNGGKTISQLIDLSREKFDKSYDCVIMQEQTDTYRDNYDLFLKGAKRAAELVREKNPDVKIYVRQTWVKHTSSRKTIDKAYKNAEKVAEEIEATLIFDGKAFEKSDKTYPEVIVRRINDDVHQSEIGGYLSAACSFVTLSGKQSAGANNFKSYANRNPATATSVENCKKMQKVADEVCAVVTTTNNNSNSNSSSNSSSSVSGQSLPTDSKYYPLNGKKNGKKMPYLEYNGNNLTKADFNDLANFIGRSVNSAGDNWGIRVATAGWALTYGLYDKGILLHYEKAGKWYINKASNHQIINHNWGKQMDSSDVSRNCSPSWPYGHYNNFKNDCYNGKTKYKGLDCDGFVSWAQRVGCGKSVLNWYGAKTRTTSDFKKAKSGDPIKCPGHMILFIKDNGDGTFITAESSSGGAAGLFFSKIQYSNNSLKGRGCVVELAHEEYDKVCKKKKWSDVS